MISDRRISSGNNHEHPFVPSWIISKFEVEKSDVFCIKFVWSMIINDRAPAFLTKKGSLGFPNSCMSWFQYCFERNIFTLDTSYSIGRMNNVLAESQSFLSFLESCIDINCENKVQIKFNIRKIAQAHLINYELVNNYGIFADAAINALKTCVGDSFDILTTLSFVRFFSLMLRYTLLESSSTYESTVGRFRRLTESFRNLFSPLTFYSRLKSRRSVFVVSEPPGNSNSNTGEYQGFGRSISTPMSLNYHQGSNDHSRNGRSNRSGHHSLPFFNSLVCNNHSSNCNSSNSSSRRTTSRIAASKSTYSHNGGDDNITSHSSGFSYHRMPIPILNPPPTTAAAYDPTITPTSMRKVSNETNIYMFQEYLEKGDDSSSSYCSNDETSIRTTVVNNNIFITPQEQGDGNDLVRVYTDSSQITHDDDNDENNNYDNNQNKEVIRSRRGSQTNNSATAAATTSGGGNVRMSRRGSSMLIDDMVTTTTTTGGGGSTTKEWLGGSDDSKDEEEEAVAAAAYLDVTTRRSTSLSPDTVTATSMSMSADERKKSIFWRRKLSKDMNYCSSSTGSSTGSQEITTIYRYHSPIITTTTTSHTKETGGSIHDRDRDRDRHLGGPSCHTTNSNSNSNHSSNNNTHTAVTSGASRSMGGYNQYHTTSTTTTSSAMSHSPPHRLEPHHKLSRKMNDSTVVSSSSSSSSSRGGGFVDRSSSVSGDSNRMGRSTSSGYYPNNHSTHTSMTTTSALGNNNNNNNNNSRSLVSSSSLSSSRRLSRQLTPPNHSFRYDKYFGEND